jgi:Flp pilus assembly pilin Flp
MVSMLRMSLRRLSLRLPLDRRAVTATEYAIIAAIIAAVLYGVVSGVGHGESNTFQKASSEL